MLFVLIFVNYVIACCGHGRLVDPPGRSSAWRYGFNTPVNYGDNQLYCGGREVQWKQFGGKCGICGDPYGGPRANEAGGRYATGTIVKSYQQGQIIQVKVELTANHKGWFEFRLCKNDDPRRRVTQSCLDRGLLPLADTGSTRFPVYSEMKLVSVGLRLPQEVTCTQCVLQWKYNAGNNWGVNPETGHGCVGCGPQEQFYGCADIAIGIGKVSKLSVSNSNLPDKYSGRLNRGYRHSKHYQQNAQKHTRTNHRSNYKNGRTHRMSFMHSANKNNKPVEANTDARALSRNRHNPINTLPQEKYGQQQFPKWRVVKHDHRKNLHAIVRHSSSVCVPHIDWASNPGMAQWCDDNCNRSFCPSTHCVCN